MKTDNIRDQIIRSASGHRGVKSARVAATVLHAAKSHKDNFGPLENDLRRFYFVDATAKPQPFYYIRSVLAQLPDVDPEKHAQSMAEAMGGTLYTGVFEKAIEDHFPPRPSFNEATMRIVVSYFVLTEGIAVKKRPPGTKVLAHILLKTPYDGVQIITVLASYKKHVMKDEVWTTDRIAQTKQFAEDLGLQFIPHDRGTYYDIPVARNPANGREVCYHKGYDCWLNGLKKWDVSKEEAAAWIMK